MSRSADLTHRPRRRIARCALGLLLAVSAIGASAGAAVAWTPTSPVQFIQLSSSSDRFLNYDGDKSFGFGNRDWPVTMIFYQDASIGKVEGFYRGRGFSNHGGKKYEYYELHSNYAKVRYDRDKGVKTPCVDGLDRHIRTYGSSQDRFYDLHYGYYVVGTTHFDNGDGGGACGVPYAQKYFGYSERVEHDLAVIANGSHVVTEDAVDLKNYEALHSESSTRDHLHWWESDGRATLVQFP
jgi:hypothetical protein